ncbi:MAG: tol-pal system protein YbgF [Proteobacteria bacterium]|nr:tol-pal system protein YbgF [Pseudomonadota bacterium]
MKNYFLLMMVLFLGSGCALNRDVLSLEDRIYKLERSAKEYQKDKNAGKDSEEGTRGKIAEMRLTIDQLHETANTLKGRFEEVDFFLQHQKESEQTIAQDLQQTRDALDNISKRLVRIEQYVGFEPSETLKPLGSEVSGSSDNLSEKELYTSAKSLLDKGNTDAAREGFQAFLKKYPNSDNADNAQFWVGEIYYREKWYEKAILEYQKVIEKYPKGNKVPAAYLKQGFAFQNMGEKANARLILKELIGKFPDSNEAKIANDKIKVFN